MKQRLDYIDIAKGIGILLVVCNHTICPEMVHYTAAVVVPIFFFCSGYTSHKKDNGIKENVIRHAVRLLKPYLLFSLLLMVYFHDFSKRAILGICYSRYCLYPFGTTSDIVHFMTVGNFPMWFLTCMAVSYLLYAVLVYYPRYRYYLLASYLLLSVLMTYLPILLPWSIDTAFLMAVIMYGGTMVRDSIPDLYRSRRPHVFVIICALVYLILLPLFDGINISVRQYGYSIWTYLVAAIAGCVVLVYISRLLEHTLLAKLFQQIGHHSLTIFSIEIPFVILGKQIGDALFGSLPQQAMLLATATTQVVIAIAGGYLISFLLHKNKYTYNLFFR